MPVVSVLQSPRDTELKRELVSRITRAFVDAYEIPPEAVQGPDPGSADRELGCRRKARRRLTRRRVTGRTATPSWV